MDLPELLEIQRINQALPFADPIARTIRWRDEDVVLKVLHWRDDLRVRKQLDKIARTSHKHGLYVDDFQGAHHGW